MTKKSDHARFARIATAAAKAESTRCNCGDHGSWERSISGSANDQPHVWAGCPNCGSTVGIPLSADDYAYYRTAVLVNERERRLAVAQAAAEREASNWPGSPPVTFAAPRWEGEADRVDFDVYDPKNPGTTRVARIAVRFDAAGDVESVRTFHST